MARWLVALSIFSRDDGGDTAQLEAGLLAREQTEEKEQKAGSKGERLAKVSAGMALNTTAPH